jgi:uncharacterized protein YceH (UPF0502 family)
MLGFCSFNNGRHVRAAARDQNNDILHGFVYLFLKFIGIIALENIIDTAVAQIDAQTDAQTVSKKLPDLTAVQARVLGTLMEKARTVPDSYPLTLNALVLGCNQKSSRFPTMELTEADISSALIAMKLIVNAADQPLVRELSGSRTTRFEHNFQRAVGVPEQSAVILGLLMLRGPQTVGELRINAERWYKFADISSVEAFLEELQDRPADKGGALVQKLPRAPGTREQRWTHLMCGPVDLTLLATENEAQEWAANEGSVIHQRISALEQEVTHLRQMFENLSKELGLSQP